MCLLANSSSVSMLLLDMLYAVFLVSIGIGVQSWLSRAMWSMNDKRRADCSAEILGRIADLASSVATDVGQHSKNISRISSDLSAARASDDQEQVVLHSLAEILRSNEQLQQQLATAEVQLQRQAIELEAQTAVARVDALTDVFNRRALNDELNRRVSEWQRRQSAFTLVMIDVDHFKKFNDTHGHQAGDNVLRGVAAKLKTTMREMDMVARFGGEEFALVLPATNLVEGLRGAERARAAIGDFRLTVGSTELKVTASLGVAEVLGGESAEMLVKRADEALYAAKKAGRNGVWYHDGDVCLAAHVEQPAKHARPKPAESRKAPTSPAIPLPDSATAPMHPSGVVVAAATPRGGCAVDFAAQLRRRITECHQNKLPLTMMVITINDLPKLTARWGPLVEELLLQHLSQPAEQFRGEFGFVSRWGTKLAIAMPGFDLASISDLAEQFREAASTTCPSLRGVEIAYTFTLGAAQSVVGDTPMSLCRRAESAVLSPRELINICKESAFSFP